MGVCCLQHTTIDKIITLSWKVDQKWKKKWFDRTWNIAIFTISDHSAGISHIQEKRPNRFYELLKLIPAKGLLMVLMQTIWRQLFDKVTHCPIFDKQHKFTLDNDIKPNFLMLEKWFSFIISCNNWCIRVCIIYFSA